MGDQARAFTLPPLSLTNPSLLGEYIGSSGQRGLCPLPCSFPSSFLFPAASTAELIGIGSAEPASTRPPRPLKTSVHPKPSL